LSEVNLIDIEYSVNRIKMDNEWYLRMGPNCWYVELDGAFEPVFYVDAVEIEEQYQTRKKQNESS